MNQNSGLMLEREVLDVAIALGYEATMVSDTFRLPALGWVRGGNRLPDLVVKGKDRTAIVEIKTRPVMIYDIFQIDQMRENQDVGAIFCVPDSAFNRIRNSVREYAGELNVQLCPLSKVGEAMKSILD